MLRLRVAFVDGTIIDEVFPNHEVDDIEIMVKETHQDLLIRVELEDSKGNIIYYYKRKQTYVY